MMPLHIDVDSLRSTIAHEGRVVVVTGAGVSTGSGIPDFASTDDVWSRPVSREVATSKRFFESEPELFWEYYKNLFSVKTVGNAQPCGAHNFLKELEAIAEVEIFTQNVDGLHTVAGSTNVVEVHGNAQWLACINCDHRVRAVEYFDHAVPSCSWCGSRLKPTVVLFGESSDGYYQLRDAYNKNCVALFMGTSLRVSPINGFPYQLAAYAPHITRVYWNDVMDEQVGRYFHQHLNTDLASL